MVRYRHYGMQHDAGNHVDAYLALAASRLWIEVALYELLYCPSTAAALVHSQRRRQGFMRVKAAMVTRGTGIPTCTARTRPDPAMHQHSAAYTHCVAAVVRISAYCLPQLGFAKSRPNTSSHQRIRTQQSCVKRTYRYRMPFGSTCARRCAVVAGGGHRLVNGSGPGQSPVLRQPTVSLFVIPVMACAYQYASTRRLDPL